MAKAKPQAEFDDIETAPKDGTAIEVSEDGENFVEVRWYRTRRMDKKIWRWVEHGHWMIHRALVPTKLPFEPLVWRPRLLGK